MSTIVTRTLSLTDDRDTVAIKVESDDYVGMTGIIEIDFNNVTWTAATNVAVTTGILDIRPPVWNLLNDTPILDSFQLAQSQGTHDLAGAKYFISVINGRLGPCTLMQFDGTVDLFYLTVKKPDNINNFNATLDYSIGFTDLNPLTIPTSNGSVQLNLSPDDGYDTGFVSDQATTLAGKSGYCLITPINLVTTSIVLEDTKLGPPYFQLYHTNGVIIGHFLTNFSGKKNYPWLSDSMVFAVNNGKGDANTFNLFSDQKLVSYLALRLDRTKDWPGNAGINVLFNFTKTLNVV
jgi:hypothetical protein